MKYTDSKTDRPDNEVEILITIPWSTVDAEKITSLTKLKDSVEIEGFRKGKAPEKMVREKLGEQRLLEEATKNLLTELYGELLKKYDIRPYIDPSVDILKAPVGGEWEVRFKIAQAPTLRNVPDYKKLAEAVHSEEKKDAIWVPGKDKEVKQDEDVKKKQDLFLQKLLDALLKETTIVMSSLIIEYELNRRLANLHDEIAKLGMSVEQYLQAKHLTKDTLREQLIKEVREIYSLELLIEAIADAQKIVVEKNDFDKVKATQENAYLYSRLIRKQKTLDFLSSL